jgi:hypothetical protein
MVFGMSLPTFTLLHVAISLVGIVSGLVVMFGLLSSDRRPGWTALFLLTTILTSVTGFGFPFTQLLPSHILAIISLVLLAMIGSQGVQFLLADRSSGSFFVSGFGPATGLVLAATGLVTLALYAGALPDPTAQA